MKFYLGIHSPSLTYKLEPEVSYMLSARLLIRSNRKKRVYGDWILDSGGFTEILQFGKYTYSPERYIELVEHFDPPNGAFCMDWMCEPIMFDRTRKTMQEHQELTVENYLLLTAMTDKQIHPVLQGWTLDDYLKHALMYSGAGVSLDKIFGLGSVCSRSRDTQPGIIIENLKKYAPDLKLHGFGLKISAFRNPSITQNLDSADSMAWSYAARKRRKDNSRNDLSFALPWRNKILGIILDSASQPKQELLI